MNYSETVKKVERFFIEHPIHSVELSVLSEYLEMDKFTLNEILSHMYSDGKLEKVIKFKASKKFIAEIIKSELMNLPNKLKSDDFQGNDYTKKLDCGCTIFGDDAGWHHTGFCKEHQKMIDEARKEDEEGE